MALRITLKPGERLYINGALIRNGSRNSDFLVENHCRMLRGGEIIPANEVDTPCKQIWMTMQVLHLSDDSAEAQELLFAQMADLINIMPSSAPFLAAMKQALEERHTHKALKEVKRLVQHEREMLVDNLLQQGAPRSLSSNFQDIIGLVEANQFTV